MYQSTWGNSDDSDDTAVTQKFQWDNSHDSDDTTHSKPIFTKLDTGTTDDMKQQNLQFSGRIDVNVLKSHWTEVPGFEQFNSDYFRRVEFANEGRWMFILFDKGFWHDYGGIAIYERLNATDGIEQDWANDWKFRTIIDSFTPDRIAVSPNNAHIIIISAPKCVIEIYETKDFKMVNSIGSQSRGHTIQFISQDRFVVMEAWKKDFVILTGTLSSHELQAFGYSISNSLSDHERFQKLIPFVFLEKSAHKSQLRMIQPILHSLDTEISWEIMALPQHPCGIPPRKDLVQYSSRYNVSEYHINISSDEKCESLTNGAMSPNGKYFAVVGLGVFVDDYKPDYHTVNIIHIGSHSQSIVAQQVYHKRDIEISYNRFPRSISNISWIGNDIVVSSAGSDLVVCMRRGVAGDTKTKTVLKEFIHLGGIVDMICEMVGFQHMFTLNGRESIIKIVGSDGARNVFLQYLSSCFRSNPLKELELHVVNLF